MTIDFKIGLLVFNACFMAVVTSVPLCRQTQLDTEQRFGLSVVIGAGMSAGLILAPEWFLITLFLFYALTFFSVFFSLIVIGIRLIRHLLEGMNGSVPPRRNQEPPPSEAEHIIDLPAEESSDSSSTESDSEETDL